MLKDKMGDGDMMMVPISTGYTYDSNKNYHVAHKGSPNLFYRSVCRLLMVTMVEGQR